MNPSLAVLEEDLEHRGSALAGAIGTAASSGWATKDTTSTKTTMPGRAVSG